MTTIYPTLIYDDAHAAIEFLCDALGCERHSVSEDGDGRVVHAELRFRDAFVMLSQRGAGDPRFDPGRTVVYVAVDDPPDIDALHERVRSKGADVVMPPTDQDYGSRDFSFTDPEGNVWAFGTYAPSPP